jgi:hypothetical protein
MWVWVWVWVWVWGFLTAVEAAGDKTENEEKTSYILKKQ